MNVTYLKDLNSVMSIVASGCGPTCHEVIIYPDGNEGQLLLRVLYYNNLLRYVSGIATSMKSSVTDCNTFIYRCPLISLDAMQHFRESATFIIAGSPQNSIVINKNLIDFGCKTVLCLDGSVYNQMNDWIKQFYSSGQIMIWTLENLTQRLSNLEISVNMQNEICKTNTEAFSVYHNRFRGKKVVIVGCGPTLKYYEPIPNAIHISLNKAYTYNKATFNFLFAHDPGTDRIEGFETQGNFHKITDRVFIGRYVTPSSFSGYTELATFASNNVSFYFKGDNELDQAIYRDICCHPLSDFRSIYSAAFQFALFTYPKEIYLVGCDVKQSGHFYNEGKDAANYYLMLNYVKSGYARLKMLAASNYPDVEIISINPVGLKGLFKDIYTDEYSASLQ